ncbi:hypothetical protein BX600DRAFT_457200 [Xylariales sp. PMI_506]|nr:hypothetical protein BX600DRAFT_457200 [Xylariales sp. PMI_506]
MSCMEILTTTFGLLRNTADEDGDWEADSDTEFLIRCCGDDRPLRKWGLKLTITPSENNHFVTVYDYINVIHPWLMSLSHDILKAKMVTDPSSNPTLVTNKWMVTIGEHIRVDERERWIQQYGGGVRPVFSDSTINRILAQRRAERLLREQSTNQDSVADH